MSRISNTQAIALALVPGYAENAEREASDASNLAWLGLAKGIRISRNRCYLGLAATLIGFFGVGFSKHSSLLRYGGITLATVGGGFTCFSGYDLYQATALFQRVFNSVAQEEEGEARE